MYEIELTQEAIGDLSELRKFDLRRIMDSIEAQLQHEPTMENRNRKRLRPNQLAEWELRVENFRVFYDVLADDQLVKVVAVGIKEGNDLFVHGEKYEL